ncbi:hypothetical protein MAR_025023 [Mya arenaria]|uniref:Expansin-like EG45 domain-containing protein n=1 Tax=Mya arenaria TaxID=6604 RepID=A0ABY7DVD3_MYAAR|nr:hypothetical protein MAR_025023 [Mya arenaria]
MYLCIATLLYLAVAISALHDNDILNLYKHTFQGDGTYYGAKTSGLCSLDVPHLPPVARHVDKLVALNGQQMFGSSACGMCLQVTGSGQGAGNDPITGTFTAYVKDLCPECLAVSFCGMSAAGSVDLAEDGDGRWGVSIRAVQCPSSGPIEYALQGSNDWYIKLQVRNEIIPATTVEMFQPKSGIWVPLARTADGFWTFPASGGVDKPIQRPIQLRLTSPTGQTVTDHINPSIYRDYSWPGQSPIFLRSITSESFLD